MGVTFFLQKATAPVQCMPWFLCAKNPYMLLFCYVHQHHHILLLFSDPKIQKMLKFLNGVATTNTAET